MMNKVFIVLCSMVIGYLAAPSNIGAGLKELVVEAAQVAGPVATIVEAEKVAEEIASAEEKGFETVVKTAIKAEDAVEKAVESADKNDQIYKVLPLVFVPGGSFIYAAEQLAKDSQKEAKNEPADMALLAAISPFASISYAFLKAIKAEDAVENAVKSAIKNGEIYNALPSLFVPGGSLIFMAKEALAEDIQKVAKNESVALPLLFAFNPLASAGYRIWKLFD